MRILIDCDGVLSSFTDHVRFEINDALGTDHKHEDLEVWELYDALNVPDEVKKKIDAIIMTQGFCAGLPEIPDARIAVDSLRAVGHKLYCVTAPFVGMNWMPERRDWLRRHMGFHRKQVIFCYDKEVCHGDVLIDDKVENLLAWQAAWPRGKAILFHQPWNVKDERWTGLRANNWREAIDIIAGLS